MCSSDLGQGSIFKQTYWQFETPDAALLARWASIRAVRDQANKAIEAVRTAGGCSLVASTRWGEASTGGPAAEYEALRAAVHAKGFRHGVALAIQTQSIQWLLSAARDAHEAVYGNRSDTLTDHRG